MLLTDPGEQDTQVIIHFGDGTDRRARIAARGLLLDGDGRRQARKLVVHGLVHLAEELPRVGRQRLDVAALAFGVQSIEGKRGLARARHAGEHDETVLGQAQVDVLEVVLSSADDDDFIARAGRGVDGLGHGALRNGRAVYRLLNRCPVQMGQEAAPRDFAFTVQPPVPERSPPHELTARRKSPL